MAKPSALMTARLLPVTAALLSVLLAGCSADPYGGITQTKLTATLTNIKGAEAQVYLYAPDEVVEVVPPGSDSCLAAAGDTLRRGTYDFWLVPKGADGPVKQTAAPFGAEPMQFNDSRPGYLTVLPGSEGEQPDLLALHQYGSCNGTSMAILALRPDGQELVTYRFSTPQGERSTIGVGKLEALKPGLLRTTSYNNSTGMYYITEWQVKPAEALLVPVKEETRRP